jgi:hypothetical protein
MATTDERSAEARLAALRRDPDVIIRQRTKQGPLEPAFEVVTPVDVLEFMGRQGDADELAEAPER